MQLRLFTSAKFGIMNSEEKILKLISYDDCSNDEAIVYLQSLRNKKIENLKKDKSNLKDAVDNIDFKTQEIAFSNYPAFIKTSESSRAVLKGWNEATKTVETIINKGPSFLDQCDQFSPLKTLSAMRLNMTTMKKHVVLLEIMELPQLMTSLLEPHREERYEDALELAAYVAKMGVNFENTSTVNSIVKSIEESWNVMVSQLLNELRSDLTLPKCLKVVGFLRRMQAFSNLELKLKFLQVRDGWFKEILSSIPKSDVQNHLTKTVEFTRVHLFNIVTQYRALFEEDFGRDGNTKQNLLFSMWLHEKINDFLLTVEADLLLCNFNLQEIGSMQFHCMYFGVSFSRIGFDFRAQLAPIFLKTTTKYLSAYLLKATKQFEVEMEQFTLINKDMTTKRAYKGENSEKQPVTPVDCLLDFQPLAVYYNALINLFNELRVCTPIAVLNNFTGMLEGSLISVAKSILSFYRNEQFAFNTKEKEEFLRMCSCFSEMVLHLTKCVQCLMPPKLNFKESASLRKEQIFEPIQHLLPENFKTSKI